MYMLPIVYIIILLCVREASAYKSCLLIKKYIKISNPTVARIFVSEMDPAIAPRVNAKANRNKITIVGLICYVMFALLLITHLILLLIDPIVSSEYDFYPRVVYFYARNINELIIALSTLLFAGLIAVIDLVNTRYITIMRSHEKGHKLLIVLFWLFCIGLLWLALYAMYELIRIIIAL